MYDFWLPRADDEENYLSTTTGIVENAQCSANVPRKRAGHRARAEVISTRQPVTQSRPASRLPKVIGVGVRP